MKIPCKRCNGSGIEPDQTAIGKRVRKIRKEASISSQQMAKKLRLSPSFYCELEAGKKTWKMKTIRALCIALQVSADFLLDL
jgi:transcriptional regulator with XRE-family HTH domain